MVLKKLRIIALALFAVSTNGAGLYKGVATIHETQAAGKEIRGSLIFTHRKGGDGKYYMEVEGELTGLPDGIHGFHIHQFGDESISEDGKNRYGSHFIPTCQGMPEKVDPDCSLITNPNGCPTKPDHCAMQQTHGLPPDRIRQAGDMGNIEVRQGQVTTKLPAALVEVKKFGEDKMTLNDPASSILGRAVAIHKFQDIGRQLPLYDGLCLVSCGVDTKAKNISPPGPRGCNDKAGKVKYADLGFQDEINRHKVDTTKPFGFYDEGRKNVVARYPTLDENVWYKVKITKRPSQQTQLFDVEFDNDSACARRKSAQYLTSTKVDNTGLADDFGAAGPAIAGGIVGRMNPNEANDGITPNGNKDTDETKPAMAITQISCFLRAIKGAGDKSIGGEALLLQTPQKAEIKLQAKLVHGASMGGKEYSFHFHDYGDLRQLKPADGDKRRVGKIYNEGKQEDIIALKTLKIPQGQSKTFVSNKYTLPAGVKGVDEYVGRSLTIHSGKDKSTPTVSYGVCGIANPDSPLFFTTTEIVYEERVSTTAALGLSFASSLLVALFF